MIIQRCNAVHFESNLCEEAKLKELKEADVDEEEKDVLIRLEDARQVQHVWKRLLPREIEDGAHGIHNIV